MKFIRQSITLKAILLLLLILGLLCAGYFYLQWIGFNQLPTPWVLIGVGGLLAFVFLVFLLGFVRPLSKVTAQITNLLMGKDYHRVASDAIDEIGVVTHFFNEITEDLEKISNDIKEQRRMSSELDIAAGIQKDVLPKEVPKTPGLDVVAKTRAAAQVGGDIFDFLLSSDESQLFIYIGDVTGHGVPSGLIMMMAETLVTAMVYQGVANSQELVVRTNYLLQPRISNRLFMTSVVLRWDKGYQKMHYTGAGHEHILVYRHQSETVEAITSGGIALGMIPDVSKIVKENEIPLSIGDSIVLYTDGITEAKNPEGQMYGLPSLTRALEKNGYKPSAESIFEGLTKDFASFVGEYVQNDDITMMVIKYTGDTTEKAVQLTISKEEAQGFKNKNWSWD